MNNRYYIGVVLVKEMLSNGAEIYVAHCTSLGIASQGSTTEEAMKNVREAIDLYLEEQPDENRALDLPQEPPFFSVIEVYSHAKVASALRY